MRKLPREAGSRVGPTVERQEQVENAVGETTSYTGHTHQYRCSTVGGGDSDLGDRRGSFHNVETPFLTWQWACHLDKDGAASIYFAQVSFGTPQGIAVIAMLISTFQHLHGIGRIKELELWNSGIISWDKYGDRQKQLSFLPEESEAAKVLESSRKALAEENADFFAQRLPHSEHYRVALSFPEKTMFLDIETTGLSKYYDHITLIGWSMGTEYHVHIQGQSPDAFFDALKRAKAIVTFNGAIFDLPFVKQTYSETRFPEAHIDLRFFGKSAGLSGGQKEIETQIGFIRQAKLKGIQGEAAPILWHKYRRGDNRALKLLIEYNHADIEGMKTIFDTALKRTFAKRMLPPSVIRTVRFSKLKCRPTWSGEAKIAIEPYKGPVGPKIHFSDLSTPKGLKVVGIDLTGSEKRASGWCLIEENEAITKRLLTDEEIVSEAVKAHPHLISIDSPLSLPVGRTMVTDDDPGRDEFGIMRQCERMLKKRGVNVYPSLINSMQQLTARGIRLAERFRKMGIPAIESYPGAAQDIMGIPRKGAGVEYLLEGLTEFGVRGEFQTTSVSHDELDAITSSIVGVFFWAGKFEALGNETEEYLIIPNLNVDTENWLSRKIVGFSGPIASGKTTAAKLLVAQNFAYARFSDVLAKQLTEKGVEISRDSLQTFGQEVHENFGQRWLCKKLIQMLPTSGNVVIDGLRFPEDHAFMVETFGPAFRHYNIEVPEELRKIRYEQRCASKSFVEANAHTVEQGVSVMKDLALTTVENHKNLGEFERLIKQLAQ